MSNTAMAVLINANLEVLLTEQATFPWLPVTESAIHLNFDPSPPIFTLPQSAIAALSIPDTCCWVPARQAMANLSTELFAYLARAMQACHCINEYRFCSRCGSNDMCIATQPIILHCNQCHYDHYPPARPAVIVVIRKGEYLLLAKANRTPASAFYSAIAGFVEIGENFEHALAREAKEEVGVNITNIEYIASQAWPFGASIMVGYIADYAGGDIVLQASEIADAQFFHYTQLPSLPAHTTIAHQLITTACNRIAVAYTTPAASC